MAVEKEEPEVEETHFDRKKKYRELIAKGVGDKEAVEAVWPSSSARIAKNAKDAADLRTKSAPTGAERRSSREADDKAAAEKKKKE